jgi:hypothetical protein
MLYFYSGHGIARMRIRADRSERETDRLTHKTAHEFFHKKTGRGPMWPSAKTRSPTKNERSALTAVSNQRVNQSQTGSEQITARRSLPDATQSAADENPTVVARADFK